MERFSGGQAQGEGRDDLSLARIPVFVFPSSLVFNSLDRDHLKQILTIYNPYDFPIRFKVLSTFPTHYTVTNPEGSIKPKNCIDLIVRLTSQVPYESSSSPPLLEDKFRVQIFHYHTKKALGKKDIPSVIHFGSSAQSPSSKYDQAHGGYSSSPQMPLGSSASEGFSPEFQQFSGGSGFSGGGGGGNRSLFPSTSPFGQPLPYRPNIVAIVTALFCIIGLMLPSEQGDPNCTHSASVNTPPSTSTYSSFLPSSLYLSVNQKLLLSYTLGLVTLIIFRP